MKRVDAIRTRRIIDDGAERTRNSEIERKYRGDKNWPYYTTDAIVYFNDRIGWLDTFESAFPETLAEVKTLFAEGGAAGVYVDLCGIASGVALGAPRSVALTLERPKMGLQTDKTQTILLGNILERRSMRTVVHTIEQMHGLPLVATMMPGGGFSNFEKSNSSESRHVIFSQLLQSVAYFCKHQPPGSLFFAQNPFGGRLSPEWIHIAETYLRTHGGIDYEITWGVSKLERSMLRIKKPRI